MKKIIILGILMSIIACAQNKYSENSDTKVIKTILSKVYSEDRKNENPLKNTQFFSKEIIQLNKKCDSLTKVSTEQIAKSNYPSDKPLLREGSYVSSIYEGATDFVINEIKTNEKNTEVIVTLSNKLYKEQKPWKEKIVFIDENGLKIDNIFFDENLYHSDLKEPSLKKSLVIFFQQKL